MANLKAVLQRPKVSASYSRNAFDRGFSPKVHYQLGGLQPFMAEPVIAGSHMKLNRSIFQRTAAVNTAAFPKVDTHCEFFYVPLRLLWSYWNDFKLNIQDYNSSYQFAIDSQNQAVAAHNPSFAPRFNLASIHNEINGWLSNHFTTGNPSTHFSTRAQALGANRLLDAFGYSVAFDNVTWIDPSQTSIPNMMVNAFKLLAYQKVYYDHFRNTAYESNDPTAYNADGTFTPNAAFDDFILSKMLTYHYVNYRKDYFQSIYPALNYTVSSPNGMSWVVSDSVIYKYSSSSNSIFGDDRSGGQTAFLIQGTGSPTVSSVGTVQQIRAAFALDKLLRASAYAPKHVKDQFEARYGVKGIESGNESVRIGAFMNDIVFQEVTNMANTAGSGSNLGEIGGKGVGYNGFGDDIEFTAKEDGIVLGLMYSMPRTSYDSTGISNWNMKDTREDFFVPEYMDLGLQPIYKVEGFYWLLNNNGHNNELLGYKDRYSEYKIGIDVNHGLFNQGRSLSDFVTHSNKVYFNSFAGSPTAEFFKVKPTDLDSVFVQATSVDDWLTDKFITYLDIKFIVNQNMSVHGQPRLGGIG